MEDFGTNFTIGAIAGLGFSLLRGFRGAGLKTAGAVSRAGRAGMIATMKSGRGGLRAAIPALLGRGAGSNRYSGILAGAGKFGAGLAVSAGINALADQDGLSAVGSGSLRMAAAAAKFGAYRGLIRGGVGTGFAAAERITGSNFSRLGNPANRLLGGVLTRGSLVNRAVLGASKGIGGWVAKFPGRLATGMVQAPVSVGRAIGSLSGRTLRSVGDSLDGRVLGYSFWKGGPKRTKFAQWLYNKHLDAPIGHGLFAYAGAIGGGLSYLESRAAQSSGYRSSIINQDRSSPNPAYFGGGIQGMKRGTANNDPSLTLQLHHNNTRVMP
jgi:hypothetical protein